jgi:quinol monooxygenase YgiN
MLIIAGTITIDPARRNEGLAFAQNVMVETRKEDGCQNYVFSADPVRPDTIMVYELWDSEEQLAPHFETPHLTAFQAGLGNLGVTGIDLKKYQIASSDPL